MNKKKHRICFVETTYTLLLYLLSCTEEEIHDTLYVTNGVLGDLNLEFVDAEAIRKEFERAYLFWGKFHLGFVVDYFVRRKILRKASSNAILFAQDHIKNTQLVLGRRHYTWIEDAQNFLSTITDSNNRFYEFFWRRMYPVKNWRYYVSFLLYGNIITGMYAHNRNCKHLLLSRDDKNPSTLHIPRTIIDIKQTWESSSIEKKKLILSIFKVDELMLESIERYPVILLTQNLFSHPFVTREEQVDLYKKIIDKYGVSNVLVKTHLFDDIPYEQYIPSINILRGSIPAQLLGVLGMQDKILATIFSSAVFSIDHKRIDWYLEGLPEEIKAKMPSVTLTIPVNHCNI